ncbi:MAG TPA: DUF1127 domain-containing protein [Kiloniellaceae bacterium]|nr:DUF1127 domain-containing protein [Kiloniellaceae bacterium]
MISLTRDELAGRTHSPSGTPLLGRLFDYFERRKVYNTLVAMDDRLLEDLGLTRGTLKARIFESETAKRPSLFARLRQSFKAAQQRRATIKALQRLSPAMLADIGIEPGLITTYALSQQGHGDWVFEPNRPSLGRVLFDLAEATAAPFTLPAAERLNPGRMARVDGKHLDDIGYVTEAADALETGQRTAANRDDPKAAA